MSITNGISDAMIGELFRSLVLKAVEDASPELLHDIFHGEREGSDGRILSGLKAHNDAKHANLQGLISNVSKAKRGLSSPRASNANTPRLPSGKPDFFAGSNAAVRDIFRKK